MVKKSGPMDKFYSCTEPHWTGEGICGSMYSTRIAAENCFCHRLTDLPTHSSALSRETSDHRMSRKSVANEVRGLMYEMVEIGDDFFHNLVEEISSQAKLGQRCMLVGFLASFSEVGIGRICNGYGSYHAPRIQFIEEENWPGGWTLAGVDMVKEDLQAMGFRVRDTLENIKDVKRRPAPRKFRHNGREIVLAEFNCIDKNGVIGTFSWYPKNRAEEQQVFWNLAIYW